MKEAVEEWEKVIGGEVAGGGKIGLDEKVITTDFGDEVAAVEGDATNSGVTVVPGSDAAKMSR